MRRVLVIDQPDEHSAKLEATLRLHGFDASVESQKSRAAQTLQQHVPVWEYVVLVARGAPEEALAMLHELKYASQRFQQSGFPEFVFASWVTCTPSIRIQIARTGARYVHL